MTTRDVFYSSCEGNYCQDCGCAIPASHTLCNDCWVSLYNEEEEIDDEFI